MSEPRVPRKNPDALLHNLRRFFILHLMRSPTFDTVADELEREWKVLIANRPELETIAHFWDLPAPQDIDDPLNAYVTHVRSTVANTLRCRVNGAPADWVCHALHAAASGAALDQDHLYDGHLFMGDVWMMVTTFGNGGVAGIINGHPVGDLVPIESQPHAAFSSWKKLKKAAHERVDEMIDRMKSEVASATEDWPRQYERGYTTRIEVTMPKLVAWLVERTEMFDGDQTATNMLLHEVGLDPPGRS